MRLHDHVQWQSVNCGSACGLSISVTRVSLTLTPRTAQLKQ